MTLQPAPMKSTPGQVWLIAGAAVASALVLWATIAAMLFLGDARRTLGLNELSAPGNTMAGFQGMHEDTTALCAGLRGCNQGYSADHAVYRRFDTLDEAGVFAKQRPHTYRSYYTVVEYTDGVLTPSDRRIAESWIDGIAASD